jgi:hypothetical protein
MSATGRGESSGTNYVRDPDDFFATPAWCVEAILPYLSGYSAMDPCAGTGAIMQVLRASGTKSVRGIELNARRAMEARCVHGDALAMCWGSPGRIVMNPPFALAMEFVTKALREVQTDGEVAVLLRLCWLASQDRASFHRDRPSDIYVLPSRPEFVMSCSCGMKPKCRWSEMRAIGSPRPKACGGCSGKASVSTSDAADYAWFVWGPGRGNRWSILRRSYSSTLTAF